MAYVDGIRETIVVQAANIATTGVKGRLSAGRFGFRLVGASVTIETAVADAAQITIKRRPTAGSTSGNVSIDTLEIPTSAPAGRVIYLDGLSTRVYPGEDLAFDVTDAGASGVVTIKATIDEDYDAPLNSTNLQATT